MHKFLFICTAFWLLGCTQHQYPRMDFAPGQSKSFAIEAGALEFVGPVIAQGQPPAIIMFDLATTAPVALGIVDQQFATGSTGTQGIPAAFLQGYGRCMENNVLRVHKVCVVEAGHSAYVVMRDERQANQPGNLFHAAQQQPFNDATITVYNWKCIDHCGP